MEPNKRNCIAQKEITMLELLTMLVVLFIRYKCLMPSHIYKGGLPSSRNSREFYHFLDIYMCWNFMENSRVFTSSLVLELPRSFRNWAKLALLALCWLFNPKLWAIGLVNWAVRNILPHLSSRRPRRALVLESHVLNELPQIIFTFPSGFALGEVLPLH